MDEQAKFKRLDQEAYIGCSIFNFILNKSFLREQRKTKQNKKKNVNPALAFQLYASESIIYGVHCHTELECDNQLSNYLK